MDPVFQPLSLLQNVVPVASYSVLVGLVWVAYKCVGTLKEKEVTSDCLRNAMETVLAEALAKPEENIETFKWIQKMFLHV